eukprot:5296209-Amphidinium_carterae.1
MECGSEEGTAAPTTEPSDTDEESDPRPWQWCRESPRQRMQPPKWTALDLSWLAAWARQKVHQTSRIASRHKSWANVGVTLLALHGPAFLCGCICLASLQCLLGIWSRSANRYMLEGLHEE